MRGAAGNGGPYRDQNWTELFSKANAGGRIAVLQRVRPAALFAPQRVLTIVATALQDPARSVDNEYTGPTTDADVRRALPPLLARVGQHADHAADALALLWHLGRDQPGPLHSDPDHPIRLAQELANYSVSLANDEAVVALVEQLIEEGQSDAYYWSPLELLRGLMGRTVERIRTVGFGMTFVADYVVASATTNIRARAFGILAGQAEQGSARTQYLVADLLGEALQMPSPPGRAAPRAMVDQWHDEQLRLLAITAELIKAAPAVARMELRQRLSWYADNKSWPDIAAAAGVALDAPVEPLERMLTVLAHPLDLAEDYQAVQHEIAAYAVALARESMADDALAASLNDAVEQLDATGSLHANPWPVLYGIATENPHRGARIARWVIDRPDVPLSRFIGGLLAPLRVALTDELTALLDLLDNDDVRLRRMLAGYLSAGGWYADPHPWEIDLMRRLLSDDDPTIRSIVVNTLPPLSTANQALAYELALTVDTTTGQHADLVDHVLSDAVAHLNDAQLEGRLNALERESRLAWSSWQLLGEVGKTRPERVLDLLLARARSDAGNMRPVYDAPHAHDALSGFDEKQYRDALRAIREQALKTKGLPRRNTGKLYWALDRDADSSLEVLGEWLTAKRLDRVHAAAHLLDPLPMMRGVPGKDYDGGWHMLLSRVDLVDVWLARASRTGAEHREIVRAALRTVMTSGMSGRGMGTPDERYVTTRDAARDAAARSRAGSIQRTFWTAVAEHAERAIAEDELEDEEFGEDV